MTAYIAIVFLVYVLYNRSRQELRTVFYRKIRIKLLKSSLLKYYIAYKKLIKIGLDLSGQILYTKSNNEITGKVMYNFAAPLFWYKFVFLAEIMIAEMLIVYRMKRKKHFVKRLILA